MVSAGATGQEGVDMEYSVQTVFRPLPALGIASGIRTGPARFWAALEVSLSNLGVQYGYGEHSTLPGTHSIALSWGSGGSRPGSLSLQTESEEVSPVEFPLNVNTATEEELMAVPGIGPAKASAIYSWIRTNGPIDSVERLQEVPGIGPSLMQVIRDHLTAQ
jgi:competence ComEA-like helix-hairpin-helix protein